MRWIVALGLLLALFGCGGSPEAACREAAQPYVQAIRSIADEWSDAVKLAGTTPRMSLPPQIASLQALRRKADATQPPDCLKETHAKLVRSMDTSIQAFLDFLAQKAEVLVQDQFATAAQQLDGFNADLARLAAAP